MSSYVLINYPTACIATNSPTQSIGSAAEEEPLTATPKAGGYGYFITSSFTIDLSDFTSETKTLTDTEHGYWHRILNSNILLQSTFETTNLLERPPLYCASASG